MKTLDEHRLDIARLIKEREEWQAKEKKFLAKHDLNCLTPEDVNLAFNFYLQACIWTDEWDHYIKFNDLIIIAHLTFRLASKFKFSCFEKKVLSAKFYAAQYILACKKISEFLAKYKDAKYLRAKIESQIESLWGFYYTAYQDEPHCAPTIKEWDDAMASMGYSFEKIPEALEADSPKAEDLRKLEEYYLSLNRKTNEIWSKITLVDDVVIYRDIFPEEDHNDIRHIALAAAFQVAQLKLMVEDIGYKRDERDLDRDEIW